MKKLNRIGADSFAWANGGEAITWTVGSTFFRTVREGVAFERPESSAILNYLSQGVTTARPGADGSSSERVAEIKARWEESGMGMNAVLMVGFNHVRVLGVQELLAGREEGRTHEAQQEPGREAKARRASGPGR